ncbi:hypothetical protein BAUCODRAFT_227750 [Baudoinia panamericana UAMH 10762]|uniref:UBA domain-containing protein n=1 Tax=Baudoinia panamericana (strain UAMH 10762) TaxID=717646 RepID=M2LJ74_BAUPA|nr:uncharacterized protein BAUCODRAFT_227750 [Baudoinia panamericana UAMH 10762]EMC94282.1 hypothetical protein BAUCODRAFT_227750 [Baudoinia panamericana UAMH 10762]
MDDLLGEDWQAPPKAANTAPLKPTPFASGYSGFRASPQASVSVSGATSPQTISRPSSTVNGTAKPASDSFGSLLSLKSQKAADNLSIQERQRQLLEERQRSQTQHSQLWDTLGSGRGTPEIRVPSPAVYNDEDDILAAFNRSAPVDNASHFPPPVSNGVSGTSTPAVAQKAQSDLGSYDEDDDPFGLGATKSGNGHAVPPAIRATLDDEDILGDLGKPVAERPPISLRRVEREADTSHVVARETGQEPVDRSVAELVEMGFPADNAQIALAENGGNVQAAVGWLLQQAHEESRQKARSDVESRQRKAVHGSRSPPRRQRSNDGETPAWMRAGSATRRENSKSPANGERDAAQVAQDLSSKLFKGANSIWKASQKQMAKTMAEFQQERDSSQPRWMQETRSDSDTASRQARKAERTQPRAARPANLTDEAAMLAAPRESRLAKESRATAPEAFIEPVSRGRSPAEPQPYKPASQPKFMQQAPPSQDRRPATKLSRQDNEEQTAEAYVSPARRKRPMPKPEPPSDPEVDLFSPAPSRTPTTTSHTPAQPARAAATQKPASVPVKPARPARSIPTISPSALASSAQHRKAGGEAFKRGDYAAAHESYTAAIGPIPATHPIMIVVLSNRALTALKTGDAKTAVSDADRALEIIGIGQGVGEVVDLGGAEGTKDMRDFFGKALTRKAEALEHMEKWSDAAAAWRQAVEAGVGGSVALRSRDRCEKAAAPAPAPKTAPSSSVRRIAPSPAKAPPAKSLGNSMQRPTLTSATSAEAVKKLRAANAAAEKADDEKFALTDAVDARLDTWKGGKADNLRALLQSLDGVLWEGAGWKKVGMADLVMPNKVKIVYMKAIGKVHPDKIPQDATTEQRMVSAAVFSTLNEAWDKFRTDNNL